MEMKKRYAKPELFDLSSESEISAPGKPGDVGGNVGSVPVSTPTDGGENSQLMHYQANADVSCVY